MRPLIHNLTRDNRGAAMVEFALVAPVLMLTLIGLFDLSMNMYTASMVEGAIQQAAREATIEGASTNEAAIDATVTHIVQDIDPQATLTFTRTA